MVTLSLLRSVMLVLVLVRSGAVASARVSARALNPVRSLAVPHSLSPTLTRNSPLYTSKSESKSTSKSKSRDLPHRVETAEEVLRLRGGEAVAPGHTQPAPSLGDKARSAFLDVLPASRLHLSLILFTTAVHLLGLPAPAWFALDVSKIVPQVWRLLTAVTYLGPPSMSSAHSLYLLLKLGQDLERSTGSATHMWFLLTQTVMLSVLGILLGFPFQGRALVAAVVYAWSRLSPLQPMNFQFGVQINAWHLPFCLAAIDCLSQQSLSAAWPHLLGLLTAHMFHFSRDLLPALLPSETPTTSQKGLSFSSALNRMFRTPQWLIRNPYLAAVSSESVFDFRKKNADVRSQKKKITGHVLGSSQ